MNTQTGTRGDSTFRYALIGCAAGIAKTHLRALTQLEDAQIVGMSDINGEAGAACAAQYNSPFFTDHRELLASTHPDIAVIVTPHPFHAPIALDCFAAGANVLVEKPLAVQVADADKMIAAADAAGRILAVNFQQRFRAVIEQAKALIDDGTIGPLVRTLCIEPWYRPAAYYRSASWRGTWQGEGGGVLMNQAPHTLDLLCYLGGLPSKVWGWTRTLYQAMECEDSAQAMLEYPNGAPGYFQTSTVEASRRAQLQIVGDRGSIEIVGDQLTIQRFEPSASEHRVASTEMFSSPKIQTETLTLPGDNGGHLAVYQDLQNALREGRQPRTNGLEARMSLELANGILLSSCLDRAVTLPINRSDYAELLEDLRAGRRQLVTRS